MRVITGSARGRKLGTLEGLETRPTAAHVKESVFNIIQFDIEGRRVLDLFAGTGQMGIEALSRGAALCTFVDWRRDASERISDNLKICHLEERARVIRTDALTFLSSAHEKYHLVFLDPPYQTNLLENSLNQLAAIDMLTENGIIICESPAGKVLPELFPPYQKGRTYRYGKIQITVYRREA